MKRLLLLACLTGFLQTNAQNVGIGTQNPTEKLDVNGNIKLSGNLNLNGNTGQLGQVLTSQGNNPPIWANPAGIKTDAAMPIYSEASADLFTGDIVLKCSAVADKWYDGIGLVSFRDTLFAFGGWYTSPQTGSYVINQIRYSADDGATWTLSNSVLPFSGHSFVYFKSVDGWLYIIGCDNFMIQNMQTVWRTKDMQNFTVMTTTAGWGNRTLMGGWSDEFGNLYIAGGQTSTDVSTGPNDIWRSSDAGANWTRIANNVNVNGEYFLGQNISNHMKYFNRRVYLIGGGIAAAPPYDTYSKKVFSAPIDDLTNWRRENDLPFSNGRRYASVEVWDGKLWVWSGHNSSEGNLRSICYMDNSGKWHDFKYTYTGNNPDNQISQTHAAGIAVHKDMLYRVMGNMTNEAYAIKRSSYIANMNIRDTITTKNLFVSSTKGSGARLAISSPEGELQASNVLLSDIQAATTNLSNNTIMNQIASAQAANSWISGKSIIGGTADLGQALQVTGNTYMSGLVGIGTASPITYLAGVPGAAVYGTTNAGISFANANKYWLTWINNNDLKFFEGGPGINRLTIKAGGVINIENLSGSGTRMVVADATGNLSTQPIATPGEINTASNLGVATFGLFKQKTGSDLQFKSITAPADAGVELVSNTNDIAIKNNAFTVYGKTELSTNDATPGIPVKTITPADNSAGTLEVDMSAVSNSLGMVTGIKYIRYKKSAGIVTITSITDVAGTIADGDIASADWTVVNTSGDLQIKVTGVASTTIKWRPVYKLNQVTVSP